MPVLGFLLVSGSVLVALLFLADATLEKNGSPPIVTSQRSGLPEPSRHPETTHVLTSAPAPAPDMKSQAVLDAQPKPEPPAKIEPAARAARAEALPLDTRFTAWPPIHSQQIYPQQNRAVDRFSIRGQ
jgi:hypothetical protein